MIVVKHVLDEETRKNIRAALILSALVIIAFVFGLVGAQVSNATGSRLPLIGVWVATLIATLPFYRFRGEQKKQAGTGFSLWLLACVLLAFVSVAIASFERWVNQD